MRKKTIRDIDVRGKKTLVRCDFNVPMQDGAITDDSRITAALPTIIYLKEHGARIILMSHLGRPGGEPKPEFSLGPVAGRLSELLCEEVKFARSDAVVDDSVREIVSEMKDGEIVLLENTRYRKEETKNKEPLTGELASLGEIFVNDAFGTAHRAHCSTAGLASYMPAVSGFLLEKEIKYLGDALDDPERPFVGIMGGSKVSDKIKVIGHMLDIVDTLLIGGGMAYTFLKAKGCEIGTSILDEDGIEVAREMMEKAAAKDVRLILPVDTVCSREFDNDSERIEVPSNSIPEDMMGMDIGTKTCEMFGEAISEAKTVIWNGPMGVFEMPNFAGGTYSVAKAMAESGATTVIGGGDSAAAVKKMGFGDKMTHISTGGGASLEFLEGNGLPGVDVLEDK